MADYEFPSAPNLENAYRTAHTALASLLPQRAVVPEAEASFPEVLSQFQFLVDQAEMLTIGQIGAPISWEAPRTDGDWNLIVAGIDLDGDAHDFGDIELRADAFTGPKGTWHGSALDRAGLAYKRACGWDFTPGNAGVWLVMLAPLSASGGDGLWGYGGRLVSFVLIYDRDNDGAYESIGHIWTASAWHRRGLARHLLTEARARFPITNIEKPYTTDGSAFLAACQE